MVVVKGEEMNCLTIDCEIVNAISGRNKEHLAGITYCQGWDDFEGMGLSVVGAIDHAGRSRVFCRDNLEKLQVAIDEAEVIVTYNGLRFDNRLLRVHGITIRDEKSYDLLAEIWRAKGLDPFVFDPSTHGWVGLDAVAQANGLPWKTGYGALAPVQWQRGQRGAVIDYCLHDCWLTRNLFVQANHGPLDLPGWKQVNLRDTYSVLKEPLVRTPA
jgi:hypothetical protein